MCGPLCQVANHYNDRVGNEPIGSEEEVGRRCGTTAMAAGVTPQLWGLQNLLTWEAVYSTQASLN